MSLERTFSSLLVNLRKLNAAIQAVHLTVSEDNPRDSVALVDALENGLRDLLGYATEAISAAQQAVKAAGYPLDLELARHRLSFAHERLLKISSFFSDLIAYERMHEFANLARRGREWPGFVNTVRAGLAACRSPLEKVNQAIAVCWEELAERIPSSVSVRVTNVGQKIVRDSEKSKEEKK